MGTLTKGLVIAGAACVAVCTLHAAIGLAGNVNNLIHRRGNAAAAMVEEQVA